MSTTRTLRALLALAGLASAALEPRELIHRTRSRPSYIHHRDVRGDSDSHPCAILSEVYESAGIASNESFIADVPPSIGLACLKSVPVDKKRDLELLEYLRPYIAFQSTIETLADPPEEYLLPGVDIWGGLDGIEQKLKKDKYKSQYDVMNNLRSIFVAAADNHFDYTPALLNTILFVRRDLDLVSISADGIQLPQVYASIDLYRGNNDLLDYHPSPIKDIDGVPITEWLEADAVRNAMNYQDPDAQYNNLFSSIPRTATGQSGVTIISAFEIPDNYTINFHNGSSRVVHNEVLFTPGADFTGITSGEKFHEAFELPPEDDDDDDDEGSHPDIDARTNNNAEDSITGYPTPYVKHSLNTVAGYFLDDPAYSDTAVLTILSFLPVGFDLANLVDLDIVEFVYEAREVIVSFFAAAKESGRDKLIIDLSANGGGSVLLAREIYRLLFPDGKFTLYDRYPTNDAIQAAVHADYPSFVGEMIDLSWPVGPHKVDLVDSENFLGPYTAAGQNVTAPFTFNATVPYDEGIYLNGFEPDSRDTPIPEAVFAPENMLIITDGTCASACAIVAGLLTRNHGVRTLAFGGRATHLPMQAIGGVKGTILHLNSDLKRSFRALVSAASEDREAAEIFEDARPALPGVYGSAPLKPLVKGADGGRVNGRNGYTQRDLNGYPVHFKYEAANCRLFYTQRMTADVSETWRRAAGVAWHEQKCVRGSTANSYYTISDEQPKFDKRVKSRVPGIKGPGSLE